MVTRIIAAVALGLAFPAAAIAVADFPVSDFKTPRGAVYCSISPGEAPYDLICWTPSDGFTVSMGERGCARKMYHRPNRGYHDAVGRTLRFGQRWARVGFYCVSRRTGLTCTNRVGHGWWLARYRRGYRVF